MKRLIRSALGLIFVLGVASCADETPNFGSEGGSGALKLNLKTSSEISVGQAKTKAGEETIDAPEVNQFSVSLTKSDNSYSRTWNSVDEFNAEDGFQSGSYNIEAFYGDIDEEGFENPYFYATTDVVILEDKTTNVSLTATLANSMVSVNYSDDFKKYFADYAARVHSQEHSYIDFEKTEMRPAFIAPGKVEVFVDLDRGDGKKTTLQPTSFTAQPRHHYSINFDIAGGVGDAVLVITFDDELVGETVEIDLTDELFTTPAPEITPEGFQSGDSFDFIESVGVANPLKFNVVARAGLSDAVLTIISDTYNPPFGKEVNLCNASSSLQTQLSEAQLVARGFYKNPEECKLGYLDITEFSKILPAGTHQITFLVKDKFTRSSQPVTVTLTSNPITVNASSEGILYGSSVLNVNVETNADNSDNFSFQAIDDYGIYQNCEITSKSNIKSRAGETKNYSFTLKVPACHRSTLSLKVFYKGELKQTIEVPVKSPEYEVQADAFASKAYLKITAADENTIKSVIENLKVYVVSPQGAKRRTKAGITINKNVEEHIVVINNLTPSTNYTFNTTVFSGESPKILASVQATTEAEAWVPNGDFETLGVTPAINMNMDQGAKWSITAVETPSYQITMSLTAYEPQGWATINKLTCSDDAVVKNTWFCNPSAYASNVVWTVHHPNAKKLGLGQSAYDAVPSLYSNLVAHHGDYAMIVRNVGYSLDGKLPSALRQTGNTSFSNYYNSNVPTSYEKAVGKLFLGSYSFSGGNGTKIEGIDFKSRPSALKGYYKYSLDAGDADEKAVVSVQLLNGSEVLATNSVELEAASNFTEFSVPLNYPVLFVKATSLRIMISSSNRDDSSVVVSNHAANKDENSAYGAILTVDNLTFEY